LERFFSIVSCHRVPPRVGLKGQQIFARLTPCASANAGNPELPCPVTVVVMRAIEITRSGGPEVLEWREVPDPRPEAGEVLIDVTASAVNRADVLQRMGFYDPPPGTSPYPGLEVSGVVAEVGAAVEQFKPGDRVCALLAGGGYAERVAAPWQQVMPVPRGVRLEEAAGLPEVACTVWSNVFMLGRLRKGETLLVHGGASGIGTFAVQLAKALGAE